MHIFTEEQARALAATDKGYAARKVGGHWVVWCNDSDHVVEFDSAPKTFAFQITIRRIATGCDFHIRLFAKDAATACERATERARFAERISPAKARELSAQGIAIFRVVSCEVAADQSRPMA